MNLLVRDYLRTHSLNDLEEDHGVKSRFNAREDKFSLNYDQLKVKAGDALAEQCRGLILRPCVALGALERDREVGEVDILAWPLNRFYNLGEPTAAPVDWSDPGLKVFEKLDGTMCIMYWDPLHEKWHVATRSVPEADLPIQAGLIVTDMTFADLFWRAFSDTMNVNREIGDVLIPSDVLDKMCRDFTYVYELTSPKNRVVVRYDVNRVTLLALRHTQEGREVCVTRKNGMNSGPTPDHVQMWSSFKGPTRLLKFVNDADPAKLEGCVVLDSQWRRLKVKNKAWVLSSKAKDLVTVSRRSALECIITGTVDDILPIVETDIADKLREMQSNLAMWVKKADEQFAYFLEQSEGNRKSFASLVLANGDWPSPYFQLLDKRGADVGDWLQKQAAADKLTPGALDTLLKAIEP